MRYCTPINSISFLRYVGRLKRRDIFNDLLSAVSHSSLISVQIADTGGGIYGMMREKL